MIVKQHFGANFRALMAYLLDQDQDGHAEARIFETNIGYRDPEILLDSLEYYAGLRPRISKPVWHVILALTEDERARLDDFQAHALPSRFFAAMGITRIPFVAVRHEEGLHIMASTVDLDGRPVNLWRSIQRGRDAARTIAPDFGLDTPTRPGPFPLPALTRGEMELALRCAYGQGLPPPKYALAAAIILALEPGTHHPQTFAANLDRLGVEVSFHTTPEGVINGARYTLRDASGPMAASLTGSKIGHGYTWSHIAHALGTACQEPALTTRRQATLTAAEPLLSRAARHGADNGQPQTLIQAGQGPLLGRARGAALGAERGQPNRPDDPGTQPRSALPLDTRPGLTVDHPKLPGLADRPELPRIPFVLPAECQPPTTEGDCLTIQPSDQSRPLTRAAMTADQTRDWEAMIRATRRRYPAAERSQHVILALRGLAHLHPEHPIIQETLADQHVPEAIRASLRAALPNEAARSRATRGPQQR